MPDANMDATLNALVSAGFGSAVQRCTAISTVIFVGGSKSWYVLHQSFVWWLWFNLCGNILYCHITKMKPVGEAGGAQKISMKLSLYDLMSKGLYIFAGDFYVMIYLFSYGGYILYYCSLFWIIPYVFRSLHIVHFGM